MIGFNFTFDCQLFLFETEASYQVDGPHRERSYEQSRLIFLAVRRRGKHFIQRRDVLAYALTQ